MTLDIVVYRSGSRWATSWEEYFINGLKAHGEKFEQRPQSDRRVSDLAVVWAYRQTPLFDMQREAGRHYLIMERGFLGDRYKWTSLGLDGLNGRAAFPPPLDDGERFNRHFGHRLKSWHDGDYALVIGQVPGDASLRGLGSIEKWAQDQTDKLRSHGYRVVYRPHPLNHDNFCPAGAESSTGPLCYDLDGASLAVTYNSNAGVDSVVAGVPTITMDEGSMAWPVSSHSIDEPTYTGDRKDWTTRLSWCQWSMNEINTGEAWEHISGWFRTHYSADG